jgi:hypothetical protein
MSGLLEEVEKDPLRVGKSLQKEKRGVENIKYIFNSKRYVIFNEQNRIIGENELVL